MFYFKSYFDSHKWCYNHPPPLLLSFLLLHNPIDARVYSHLKLAVICSAMFPTSEACCNFSLIGTANSKNAQWRKYECKAIATLRSMQPFWRWITDPNKRSDYVNTTRRILKRNAANRHRTNAFAVMSTGCSMGDWSSLLENSFLRK